MIFNWTKNKEIWYNNHIMHKTKNRFIKYQDNFLFLIKSDATYNLIKLNSEIIAFTFEWMKRNHVEIVSLPVCTQSISSPMGLGSDSLPYKVFSSLKPNYSFYLADSMQFYLELLLRNKGIERVAYISPSFRGEKVDHRHLHQFYHFEIEIKGNQNQAKELVISYLKKLITRLVNKMPGILNSYNVENVFRLKKWIEKEVYDLDFVDAVSILEKEHNIGLETKNGFININSKGEKYLIQKFSDKILWLNNFPWINTPFYQKRFGEYSLTSDLLIGIGETVGLGERCFYYDETVASINNHQNKQSEYKWYLQMKKEQPLQTSGFGIGIERLILFITGLEDIRDAQIIPRLTDMEVLP